MKKTLYFINLFSTVLTVSTFVAFTFLREEKNLLYAFFLLLLITFLSTFFHIKAIFKQNEKLGKKAILGKLSDIILMIIAMLAIYFVNYFPIQVGCLVIILISFVDIFYIAKNINIVQTDELLSDEEIEEELLFDGEFSYEIYDEVCCPDCGAFLGKNVNKCENCGYGMSIYPEICPNCNQENTDKLEFCAYCGEKFQKIDYSKKCHSDLEFFPEDILETEENIDDEPEED